VGEQPNWTLPSLPPSPLYPRPHPPPLGVAWLGTLPCLPGYLRTYRYLPWENVVPYPTYPTLPTQPNRHPRMATMGNMVTVLDGLRTGTGTSGRVHSATVPHPQRASFDIPPSTLQAASVPLYPLYFPAARYTLTPTHHPFHLRSACCILRSALPAQVHQRRSHTPHTHHTHTQTTALPTYLPTYLL
jgi:hypothetical protein